MKQLKIMTFLKLGLISIIGLMVFIFGNDVNSQTSTTCASCSEQYYNCRISIDVGQCANDKIWECRRQGFPEAQCEEGRQNYEAACAIEKQTECDQNYNNCWSTCTINGNQVPPGSAPPPRSYSNCVVPWWTGVVTSSGEIVFTLMNEEDQPPPGTMYVFLDGVALTRDSMNKFQVPQAYFDNQQHTLEDEYVYGCGSYVNISQSYIDFTLKSRQRL